MRDGLVSRLERWPPGAEFVVMTPIMGLFVGAAVGMVVALAIGMRPLAARGWPMALGLVVAAGIYIGFGLADGRWPHAATQMVGALPFFALALARPQALGALGVGWIAHAGWDGVHSVGLLATTVPPWYPPACAAWDLVFGAVAIVWAISDRGKAA
jgi:hypothetical protein